MEKREDAGHGAPEYPELRADTNGAYVPLLNVMCLVLCCLTRLVMSIFSK